MKVHQVYKKIGQTPLQALNLLKRRKKILDKNLSYAGRLDPMAEGVLLVLQNASLKERNKFLYLSKEYEAEVLFGFSTDSFDVLGLPKKHLTKNIEQIQILKYLKKYQGKLKLGVPAYSSVPVKGKALFKWARAGKLGSLKIPKKEMEIKRIQVLKYGKFTNEQLLKKISKKIRKVSGDFRQEKILKAWKKCLTKPDQYQALRLNIKCGSGTYIRSLADDLGRRVGVGAILLGLTRQAVGKYRI